MAKGDKDLKISIDTEADVSGIKKTTEAVEELTKAEKERAETSSAAGSNPMSMPDHIMGRQEEIERQAAATKELAEETKDLAAIEEERMQKQREADVEQAKALKKQREEAEQAKKALDEVTTLQRVQIAQQFAEGLGRAAAATRALATEFQGAGIKGAGLVNGLATGMETVSSAVSGAAAGFAVGGPLGAAIGGTVGLLSGPLKTAINNTVNDLKALKVAEDDAAAAARGLKAAKEAIANERSRNFLAEYFQKGKEAIDAATAALQRQEQLLATRRDADNQIRESRQQSALNAGGDPAAIARADIAGDAVQERADIEARVRAAEIVAQDAAKKAAALESELGIKENSGLVDETELKALREQVNQSRIAAEQAQEDLNLAIDQANERFRVASENLRANVETAAATNEQRLASQAQALVDLIDTEGKELTEQQRRAKEGAEKALADGRVMASEQLQLSTDLKTLATLTNGNVSVQREVSQRLGELVTGMNQNYQLLLQLFDAQQAEINNLKIQLNQRRAPR